MSWQAVICFKFSLWFHLKKVNNPSTSCSKLQVGKPLVEHVRQGYNGCCFAYGPTGSGKTYSMFGREADTTNNSMRGIIPRAADQLFKTTNETTQSPGSKVSFFVSFLEINLEQLRDLGWAAQQCARGGRGTEPFDFGEHSNLEIQEDPSGMTLVKDLTYIEVQAAC